MKGDSLAQTSFSLNEYGSCSTCTIMYFTNTLVCCGWRLVYLHNLVFCQKTWSCQYVR